MFTNEETRANAQGVLDYIHQHPEKHDQNFLLPGDGTGGCGTTMCIAGTALHLVYGVNTVEEFYSLEIPMDHGFSDVAGPLLGFESVGESDWLFYEMDNEAALQKLKHLVVGDLPDFKE